MRFSILSLLPIISLTFAGITPNTPPLKPAALAVTVAPEQSASELKNETFVGDLKAENVHGFCDGYQTRNIEGDIQLRSSALKEVHDLHCVHHIDGNLMIQSNAALTSLKGLAQLQSIRGDLYIGYNTRLPSLKGLEQLEHIGGDLIIYDNRLSTIEGLEGLQTVDGNINIGRNTDLISLNGLKQLQSIGGDMDIWNNASLKSIDTFAPKYARNLTVIYNRALPHADAAGLLQKLVHVETVEILGNGIP